MQAAARGKAPFVQSVAPKGARGIATHNFSAARGHTPLGAYRNLFARAQHAINYTIPRLTRFFGTPSPSASVAKPQLQMKLQETIRGRMSMSTRVALSRPLKAGGMPRPPMVPRPMHEVGLGTARKFSSQTAFHHIVQKNTSITARAFWEADWDLKAADERRVTANAKYRGSSVERKTTSSRARRMAEDMSLYFPEAVQPAVTTYLQIALAPTPSSAMPLVADEDVLYLLPLRTILNTHASFQARAEDVAAIFAVLDEACVWNRGASVESWGDTQGLCVELRVKFDGWTELSVRQLLGPLLDTPSCSLQEFLSSSPIPSILAIDESVDSICSPAPLEFVMPQSFVTHEEPEASSVLSRSSSATFSFASDLDHLEVSSNNLFDYLSDTLSHHSSDSDEWQTSASYVTEARTPAMVLSLSSAFLSRLEDSHSVWSAEQYALYANMRTL